MMNNRGGSYEGDQCYGEGAEVEDDGAKPDSGMAPDPASSSPGNPAEKPPATLRAEPGEFRIDLDEETDLDGAQFVHATNIVLEA